ncbi:MAG TPA: GNAT family N-acetyltransferase [Bryobacteraceae bacterium]|nr:GNAT family N-acetyltransferase [Bryobacteraceae bacterium]
MDAALTIRTLTPADWPAVVALFGERGACGGCWCMWWRVPHGGKLWESVKGAPNRNGLERIVKAGQQHAVMAFAGDEPVGWCSFGPRASFPRLETVRAFRREWHPDTWAVVCFYIHRRWRRKGVAARLLEAATTRAFELGAGEIEGYPVIPKSGATAAAFAYTGFPAIFEAAGFEPLGTVAGAGRAMYIRRRG